MASSFISDLWNEWNIRCFVILSLLLQVFLTLFAPLRKKTKKPLIIFLLWLAYLMADWAVVFGIRLIYSIRGNSCACVVEVDEALQTFWASILLLHLGGPDNITAFSLEDNSLWRRHLLTLIFQIGIVIYFIVRIFPSDNSLVIPTMLLFFAGVIKNMQRILALVRSSLPRLKEWVVSQHKFYGPQPYFAQIALSQPDEEHSVLSDGSYDEEAKLDESILVKKAYCFFQIFKGFIGDLVFTTKELEVCRDHLCRISAVDALRMMSIELQFIYEILHTKRMALSSKLSYIFRFIAFTNVALSFVMFNRLKKHHLPELDVKITYSLLFGGVALDVITLFMLVFSDLNVARFKVFATRSSKLNSYLEMLISRMDYQRKPRFSPCKAELNANDTYEFLDTPLIFRRWSESIFACNLFSETLKESLKKMYKRNRCRSIITFYSRCSYRFHVAEKIIACFCQARGYASAFCIYGPLPVIANTMYMSKNPLIKKLWIFIFMEVKRKSNNAGEPEVRQIFEARGEMFLKSILEVINCHNLLVYVTEANYESSILMWHIATEMWYNTEDQSVILTNQDEREFSKILSDYMFYLLVNQHKVVSAVAGLAQVTSRNMVLELRCYIHPVGCNDVKGLCMKLFQEPLDNIRSKTLAGGVKLAREIEDLGEMKWKVMSGVWVEMLSYAAIHIKGEAHARVLSQGGELLAFVWLLMTHFGCFYNYDWGKSYEFWG